MKRWGALVAVGMLAAVPSAQALTVPAAKSIVRVAYSDFAATVDGHTRVRPCQHPNSTHVICGLRVTGKHVRCSATVKVHETPNNFWVVARRFRCR